MRLGTANSYDTTLQNIYTRQSDIAAIHEKITSTKNINRASDDPTGAAQAERALTRITRVATEQRALGAQSSAITLAESTLGDATSLMHTLRDLVVSAGGVLNATDRVSKAQEMQSLRDQLFSLANRSDATGIPLFGGLGSANIPFTDTAGTVTFNGIAGQRASTDVAVPGAMDGQAIWMNVRSGNGTFDVSTGGNTGTLSTDSGQVVSPSALTGHNYSVNFSVASGTTTFQVFDDTTDSAHSALPAPVAQTYVAGQAIQFGGMSFVANGAPANGDVVKLIPSTQTNVFKVLDDAIAGLKNTSASSSGVSQTISLALTQIDTSMNNIIAARGQAGEWLHRADNIGSSQLDRTLQLTADKSRVEDLDMVKGLSDFQKEQTNYQVALQSYAQIQKLSLFNYIS